MLKYGIFSFEWKEIGMQKKIERKKCNNLEWHRACEQPRLGVIFKQNTLLNWDFILLWHLNRTTESARDTGGPIYTAEHPTNSAR